MQTENLTDIEKARLIIMQARRQDIPDWQLVVKPQAAPTPPVASLGRTKSQRRFKGWIMAHKAAIAIFCVMAGFDLLITYCVFIAMRG